MSEVAIKVAVRVRPFSRREMEQNQKNVIRVLDTSTLIFDPDEDEDEFFFHGAKQTHRDITKRVKKKLNMEFDSVFDEEKKNSDVFEICTKPIVTSVMGGYNCSVFVYGATGAGKTFTMLGSEDNPGITFLTMRELFNQMDQLADDRKFDIGISYLEVYNELVMNLLTRSGPLKLREDANGVVVSGLVLKQIHNADELFNLLILGNKNRTQHPTDANEESSRSHAIFQVHIRMTDKKTSVRRTVKLSMIDLAGSERAQSTKCKGLRFKEGANINKSLLALGNCINKLADGCKHIPYRDSNLTRILKDSLGGNCQTLMIANISPSSLTYEDTYNTLKYASRAKKIRTTLRQNVLTSNVPKEFLLKKCNEQVSAIDKLKAENEKLKERNKMMEAQLTDQKEIAKMMNGAGDGTSKVDLSGWYEKIDATYGNYKKANVRCLSLQSNKKAITFRITFKERYEEIKKILTLDGSKLDDELKRFEMSIEKFTKEVTRIKEEDEMRWSQRLKESIRSLELLKKEIADQGLSEELRDYMGKMEVEVDNAKLLMKMDHSKRILDVMQQETENYTKCLQMAAEIIQDNYLLLRSTGELDNSMIEKLQALGKLLQGQRSVKFLADEPQLATRHINPACMTLLSDDILHISSPARKRGFECDNADGDSKKAKGSNEDFLFLRPTALKSINFESISSMKAASGFTEENGLNETFNLPAMESKVLSQQGNKAPSTSTFRAPAVKPIVKPAAAASKYKLNINKENKKSPGRSRVTKQARVPSHVPGGKDDRPKLIKSAVASSLVLVPSKDKFKTLKRKIAFFRSLSDVALIPDREVFAVSCRRFFRLFKKDKIPKPL